MKFSGRNLKLRMRTLGLFPMQIKRARYFRGHGVHSPFVYNLVRKAFMPSKPVGSDSELYTALSNLGIPTRRSRQLSRTFDYCNYSTYSFNDTECSCQINFALENTDCEELVKMYRKSIEKGVTLCIIKPYGTRSRQTICHQLIKDHECTTVDNRGFLLIFNNYLPKQHFRI